MLIGKGSWIRKRPDSLCQTPVHSSWQGEYWPLVTRLLCLSRQLAPRELEEMGILEQVLAGMSHAMNSPGNL